MWLISIFLEINSDVSFFPYKILGLPSLQKCVCEIFGEIWFGIRFEIRNFRWEKSGDNLGEVPGGLFYLPGKHEKNRGEFRGKFGENFGENFGNFVSNFATFFGNFVQQKGGANKIEVFLLTVCLFNLRWASRKTKPNVRTGGKCNQKKRPNPISGRGEP